jgi:hypothetical protein
MTGRLRDIPSRQNRGGSARQQARNNAISRRTRGWPQKVIGHQTRGLIRPNNECYRREMVKAFLHCPRILNWIDTHQTSQDRCAYYGDRLHQPARRCPACAFKNLAEVYWTKGATQANIDRKVRELDQAAFWQSLPQRWVERTTTMEDPARYGGHLINAFIDSQTQGPNFQAWEEQAHAIFFLDVSYTDTCPGCLAVTTRADYSSSILEVSVPLSGRITLDTAIQNALSGQISKHCANCSPSPHVDDNVDHDSVSKIEAAPQVLLIQILLYHNKPLARITKEGVTHEMIKVQTTVDFQTSLDLTRHQTDRSVPLQYKLQAVTSHRGRGIGSGHYLGQMRAATGIFKTNDNHVVRTGPNVFTEWLQEWPGRTGLDARRRQEKKEKKARQRQEGFTPYVLTYVMSSGD